VERAITQKSTSRMPRNSEKEPARAEIPECMKHTAASARAKGRALGKKMTIRSQKPTAKKPKSAIAAI